MWKLATLLSPEDNAMECVRMAVMWGFARLLCAIGVHLSFTSPYEGGGDYRDDLTGEIVRLLS